MSKFHELRVDDVRRETEDTVSIAFEVPQGLTQDFVFNPGQYLTLRKIIDDKDVRRSYSICTSTGENELRVAVKSVPNGLFSTFANNELKSGDLLDVMTPMGKFCPVINAQNQKNYLLFAAGSGITPILSIAKTVLEEEPNSNVTLIYGNKGFASIIFREEIEGLKNTYMSRFRLIHILSRENPGVNLYKGRITKEKCAELGKSILDYSNVDEVFLCGPEEMINDLSAQLEFEGIVKDNIHFELFTSPLGKRQTKQEVIIEDATKDVDVVLTLDGDVHYFKMDGVNDRILDAAMRAGADVPFACKGGVCCTCRAKLIEGEVDMKINYGLEKDEIEKGFILTCQSTPKSKKIVVNFDFTT
ncbi:MAG: phenylacetate-CoA oxygenase/reductase subunit PaaK [Flavobacteriales bacterium]|nr:phenylacetate-CoA oxygenase/reductase subunit PaaK [Flavobacteriales bacterium]